MTLSEDLLYLYGNEKHKILYKYRQKSLLPGEEKICDANRSKNHKISLNRCVFGGGGVILVWPLRY